MDSKMLLILSIPFLGTVLGSAMVFFMKDKINLSLKKILSGFAAGVMLSASIWSLIIPSMELAGSNGIIKWLPAAIGFAFGIIFLMVLDSIIPHLHVNNKKPEGMKSSFKNMTMLILAVTLHNIPEGMSVGVLLAGLLNQNTGITLAGVFALALGIAIQNFPEGAIVSLPLKMEGDSKFKAFIYGSLSGIVEPIATVIMLMLSNLVVSILPYLLSFAAGAMIYVVVDELIPQTHEGEHSNIGMLGVMIGFILMMVLDIALG